MAGVEPPSFVIGIDLGTTFSCAGVCKDGQVVIFMNEMGRTTTASCVAFSGAKRTIGDAAYDQGASNPKNTIFDVKRLIGCNYYDPEIQADLKRLPFKVVDANGELKIEVEYLQKIDGKQINTTTRFYPEEISAMVLTKMKNIAVQNLAVRDIKKAVVTVPARFSDSQRQSTLDAAKIAGFETVHLLNEPTAAALAYGLNRHLKETKNVMVYDLGGGTFDVTVLVIKDEKTFEVKAIAGNSHLGGTDFDQILVDYYVGVCKKHYKFDPSSDSRAMFRLRKACEQAKKRLSTDIETGITIENFHNGVNFAQKLSREKFNALCNEIFDKTLESMEMVLRDAKIDKTQIDDIVMVGGSTRIPAIKEKVRKFFNWKSLTQNIHPDESVAYGASLLAASLSDDPCNEIKDIVLLDVTPFSLGIEIDNIDSMSKIIYKNTVIPCKITKEYTTTADSLDCVSIFVYEGEFPKVDMNRKLGRFVLHGIQKTRKGIPRILVTFFLNENCILSVSAVDKVTGSSNEIEIEMNKGRLPVDQIQRLNLYNSKLEKQDRDEKRKREALNSLEDYLQQMKTGALNSNNKNSGMINYINCAIDWVEKNETADLCKVLNVRKETMKIVTRMNRQSPEN